MAAAISSNGRNRGGGSAEKRSTVRPRTEHRDGVLVVIPQGMLGPEQILGVDAILATSDEPVVVNLGDCTLGDVEAFLGLDPVRWDRDPDQVCVACPRLGARKLLQRAGVDQVMAVFDRVEDALEARALTARDRRGRGWRIR